MKKLQTFFIYILIIVGFFIVSEFLSGQLLNQMYAKINGDVQQQFEYNGKDMNLDVEIIDARATNMNGFITARVKNNTNTTINKAYLNVDLFANKNVHAITRYLEIKDLEPGKSKDYTLKFRAGYVDSYKLAIREDFPDEDYIFEIFGYEINTKNIFGFDLSNYIDAKKIKESSWNGITSVFSFMGATSHRFVVLAKSIPWWGYVGALAFIGGIL